MYKWELTGGFVENKIPKKLYSIEEFIEAYSISRAQYYILVRKKKLKIVRMGKRPMIRIEDAEKWVASLEDVK